MHLLPSNEGHVLNHTSLDFPAQQVVINDLLKGLKSDLDDPVFNMLLIN